MRLILEYIQRFTKSYYSAKHTCIIKYLLTHSPSEKKTALKISGSADIKFSQVYCISQVYNSKQPEMHLHYSYISA